MSGWTAAVVTMVLVVNGPGVSRAAAWGDRAAPAWRATVATTVAAVTGALLGAGLVTGPLLEALDLSTPTFRLGAAVVIGLTGSKWFLQPTPPIEVPDTPPAATLGLTLHLPPGPVLAARAANGDAGWVAGVVSVLAAMATVAVALVSRPRPDPAWSWGARVLGALTIVAAVAVGIDSARTV